MKNSLVCLIVILTAASSSWGFANRRKGVVFGAGIAFTPYTKASIFDGKLEAKGIGEGAHVLLGYAFDSRNLIAAEINGSYCKSSEVPIPGDYHATQGFYGVSWYHYYGSVGKSLFTTIGIGYYYFKVQYFDRDTKGRAYLLGAGYEFGNHVQFGVYLATGSTSYYSLDVSHRQLSLMVSSTTF